MALTELLLGAGAALLATSIGAAGVLPFKSIGRRAYLLLSFCAGVMIFSSAEMLAGSKALAGNSAALAGLILGILTFFAIEHMLPHAHMFIRKREISGSKKKVALLAGTITLHNIPEGFAIASAFAASPSLGWLVALSIAIQDIPEGFVISAPLACYGIATKRAFWWGVFSGVVEFAAAVVGYLFLTTISTATPIALAFSAGAMFYVAVVELLADSLREAKKQHVIACLLAGIAVAFVLAALLAF